MQLVLVFLNIVEKLFKKFNQVSYIFLPNLVQNK